MTPGIDRPLTVLIGALGGEGGGLLSDWIVMACTSAGVLVQSTSIPGVAQRTGATTYYLEMMKPEPRRRTEPVFALYPAPGHVDVVITTELVEAGRSIQNGYVSPDRTALISSSHRVMSIAERSAMADGSFDSDRIVRAAQTFARQALLEDFAILARTHGVALNAVLLGALCASGAVPLSQQNFENAIEQRGVAPDANKAGFRTGMEAVLTPAETPAPTPGTQSGAAIGTLENTIDAYPDALHGLIRAGVDRLVDYHNEAYAKFYLDRLAEIYAIDKKARGTTRSFALTQTVARFLALWMTYEDVIRVADLKSRPARVHRIRRETGAGVDDPVRITEYLKPGIEEAVTFLPRSIGGVLLGWADRKGYRHKLHVPLRVRSDTVAGYMILRVLAKLKPLRRYGHRYAVEQAEIERWLAAVKAGGTINLELGQAIASLGHLIKGYSNTRSRAFASFNAIMEHLVDPALEAAVNPKTAAGAIVAAHDAALADEDGTALNKALQDRAGGEKSRGSGMTRSKVPMPG